MKRKRLKPKVYREEEKNIEDGFQFLLSSMEFEKEQFSCLSNFKWYLTHLTFVKNAVLLLCSKRKMIDTFKQSKYIYQLCKYVCVCHQLDFRSEELCDLNKDVLFDSH